MLLPTDTAGRLLELVLHLDAGWNPSDGTVVLLNRLGPSTIEFANTLVEWMGDRIAQTFSGVYLLDYMAQRFKHLSPLGIRSAAERQREFLHGAAVDFAFE